VRGGETVLLEREERPAAAAPDAQAQEAHP